MKFNTESSNKPLILSFFKFLRKACVAHSKACSSSTGARTHAAVQLVMASGARDATRNIITFNPIKEILETEVPVFGICLGHQVLSLALGGRSFKMKFGHHGGNVPVQNELTGKVEITSQNHNFAIESGSVPGVVETHVCLNDGTLEGLRCQDLPAFSVQYHPEASPGPHDSRYLFDQFAELMSSFHGDQS